MKIIIAGSRTIKNYTLVKSVIKSSGFSIKEVVSGGAEGVDKLGERFAIENSLNLHKFPADWNKYGKSAGYRRNLKMGDYGDGLIAIQENNSKGTQHMIDIMNKLGKPVILHDLDELTVE